MKRFFEFTFLGTRINKDVVTLECDVYFANNLIGIIEYTTKDNPENFNFKNKFVWVDLTGFLIKPKETMKKIQLVEKNTGRNHRY